MKFSTYSQLRAAVRYGLTAAITALSTLYPLHPHWTWISAVVVAGAVYGIHVVPTAQQVANATPKVEENQ